MMNEAGEKLISCPYNKAHSLLPSRMQFHLTKCRQNHPNLEKICCPFNSTHMINKVELELHVEVCPDRGLVDNFFYRFDNETPSGLLPTRTFEIPSGVGESWDDPSDNHKDVLLQLEETAQSKPVLLPKAGAPKAERRNHRLNERLRYAAMAESESSRKTPPASTSQRALQETKAPEPKKADPTPSQSVDQPRTVHPPQSAPSQSAPHTNPWSGGKPSAPQVGNQFDFPTLGSKGTPAARRDKDASLQGELNGLTLADDKPEGRNAWGKPAPRQEHAKISVPAGGFGGGNRSHANPWGHRQSHQQQTADQSGANSPIATDDFPTLSGTRSSRRTKN